MIELQDFGIEMWDKEKIAAFRLALLTWYDEHKRDLPWRKTRDPYAIWVSEIMLQQTRVDTVIPYYKRFLSWFPNVEELAKAKEETLLSCWEGLGYYSRVRNMQEAAKQIIAEFGGRFPTSYQEIAGLKGIGPYTAGAIASIAFQLPEPAVDGNIMRILARLFEVEYDIGLPKNRKIFQAIMEQLIDPDRPGDFNQALMDLGASIETPLNPRPELSPVKEFSAAYQNGTMDRYPIKAAKKKPIPIYLYAMVIENERGEFLLEKNETSQLLAGFWHFPLVEVKHFASEQLTLFGEDKEESASFLPTIQTNWAHQHRANIEWMKGRFQRIRHLFTHRKWEIEILHGRVKQSEFTQMGHQIWLGSDDFLSLPFAKPQQKVWEEVQRKAKKEP